MSEQVRQLIWSEKMEFACFQRGDGSLLGKEVSDLAADAGVASSIYTEKAGRSFRQEKYANMKKLVEAGFWRALIQST